MYRVNLEGDDDVPLILIYLFHIKSCFINSFLKNTKNAGTQLLVFFSLLLR